MVVSWVPSFWRLSWALAGEFDATTPLQLWLQAGYVVDMPLSRESDFLRIAVPDLFKNKVLFVRMDHWLFIPFGSFFVVRSNAALFQSAGHYYGSPGNTRLLHTMVF
jgi:hypothetical protein